MSSMSAAVIDGDGGANTVNENAIIGTHGGDHRLVPAMGTPPTTRSPIRCKTTTADDSPLIPAPEW